MSPHRSPGERDERPDIEPCEETGPGALPGRQRTCDACGNSVEVRYNSTPNRNGDIAPCER